ncbi:unnamed protein product [Dicrocoelium dendriticum]|nr:unnamed protein product [Dicrocoelium dendriticum]
MHPARHHTSSLFSPSFFLSCLVDIVYALSSDPGVRAFHQAGRNSETPQVNTRAQSVPNADNFPTPTFPCATSSAVPKPCSLNLQVPMRNHPRLMTPVMERSGESGSILFSAQTPGSSPSPIQIDQCFTGRVIPSPHFDIPTTRQSPSRTQVPFEFLRKSNCHISDTSTYDDVAFV